MNAQDVLHAMHARYSTMQSYRDVGCVCTKFPGKAEPDELTFATFFRRPDRFRFEWTTHHPYEGLRHLRTHQAIWSDGRDVFRYSDRNGVIEREESLKMAIAGATGVSKGAASSLAPLLMPDIVGYTLPQFEGLRLEENECEGVKCYRVGIHHPNGEFYEIDIGREDLLIRRVCEPDFEGISSSEIRRNIRVDEPIADGVFQFRTPPEE